MFYNTNIQRKPDGVLFGATVLNTHPLSKLLNTLGVFHNKHDTIEDIHRFAKSHYKEIALNRVGHCATFKLQKL